MHYKTVFVWDQTKTTLRIFYKYHGLGFVPTDVSFTYRNHMYGTIQVMQLLAKCKKYKGVKYTAASWYRDSVLDRKLFMQMQRELTKLIP